jgi:hypothetical protein
MLEEEQGEEAEERKRRAIDSDGAGAVRAAMNSEGGLVTLRRYEGELRARGLR